MSAAPSSRVIRIHGARTHTLQDLSLTLPRDALTVICGVSGSGKSSLVLDTLAAESRRRLLGTLSRSDAEGIPRPAVDRIDGLPPAVATGFRARAPGRRQTLGSLTEVLHALRSLFARAGEPHCPTCEKPLGIRTREGILGELLTAPEGTRVVLLAPRGQGPAAWEQAGRDGFVRARVRGGPVQRIEERAPGDVESTAQVDVVVDRLIVKEGARERFAASVDQALALGEGRVLAHLESPETAPGEEIWSDRPWCGQCNTAWPRLSPSLLSSQSAQGACPACEGLGLKPAARARRVRRGRKRPPPPSDEDPVPCAACAGGRLAPYGAAVELGGQTLPQLCARPLAEVSRWLGALVLDAGAQSIAAPARDDALERLRFLLELGMGHLALGRAANTLSAGELSRARLSAACAARMSGLLFLLDEPTAGLHPNERGPLIDRLLALVAEGNTVICIEHDLGILQRADHILELGPGSGREGGRIVAQGTLAELLEAADSPTSKALRAELPPPRSQPRPASDRIVGRGARRRTLQGIDFEVPVPGFTVITGPSGSGKTTLARDVIAPAVARTLEGRPIPSAWLESLKGARSVDRVVVAEARAARQPRATAGGVLGSLRPLREVFAATLEARARGYGASWFSTHVPGGRCEDCQGTGERTIALRDLPAHRVPCETCAGSRFHPEAGRVRLKGLGIGDVLALTVQEAATMFRDLPRVAAPLRAARDVGLGYVRLGESPARLSSGEALRLSLAAALGKGRRTRTLYVLDEPAAGLHPQDVAHLIDLLVRLGEKHAVLAVEHHELALRRADHILHL